MMTDNEIIHRVRQGEVELFKILVERHHRPLLSFIRSIVRDSNRSEDVGQTVFLLFYQHFEQFDEDKEIPVTGWLYTVARNLAINDLKKERRYFPLHERFEVKDHKSGPLELLLKRESHSTLIRCLKQLAEPYRSTIFDSLQGDTIDEIAKKRLTLPGTVKSRLHRARKKLSALLLADTGS